MVGAQHVAFLLLHADLITVDVTVDEMAGGGMTIGETCCVSRCEIIRWFEMEIARLIKACCYTAQTHGEQDVRQIKHEKMFFPSERRLTKDYTMICL